MLRVCLSVCHVRVCLSTCRVCRVYSFTITITMLMLMMHITVVVGGCVYDIVVFACFVTLIALGRVSRLDRLCVICVYKCSNTWNNQWMKLCMLLRFCSKIVQGLKLCVHVVHGGQKFGDDCVLERQDMSACMMYVHMYIDTPKPRVYTTMKCWLHKLQTCTQINMANIL